MSFFGDKRRQERVFFLLLRQVSSTKRRNPENSSFPPIGTLATQCNKFLKSSFLRNKDLVTILRTREMENTNKKKPLMEVELEKMVCCPHLCPHQSAQATRSAHPVCPQSPANQRSFLLLVPGPCQFVFHL